MSKRKDRFRKAAEQARALHRTLIEMEIVPVGGIVDEAFWNIIRTLESAEECE
jgi:hypothetical protein